MDEAEVHLFGRKMITVKPAVAETSHTSNTKYKAGQSEVKKTYPTILFSKNGDSRPGVVRWGGGVNIVSYL